MILSGIPAKGGVLSSARRAAITVSSATSGTDFGRRYLKTNVDNKHLSGSLMSDVHGTKHGKKPWRNKPLFRREGDQSFRTGIEASEMLIAEAKRRDPYQVEYLQAVEPVIMSLAPVFERYPRHAWVMKQLMEPERVIQFRVPWLDDTGNARVNRGYRVQYSSALGIYQGGLRFYKGTGLGSVKCIGFENVFKHALKGGMGIGAAAGGSDFNPNSKSEAEIQRFCQSFMTELVNYIGASIDIPTPDIGIGQVETGYLYGQYKRIKQKYGKSDEGLIGNGVLMYPQATGHGVAYFAEAMLNSRGDTLSGKRCVITGSGNVALNLASKLAEKGAIVLSLSDSSGWLYEPDGFDQEKLQAIRKIKQERGARIGAYIMSSTTARYHPAGEVPCWDLDCDLVFPCASQYQITAGIATTLANNKVKGVIEGAYAASTPEAMTVYRKRSMIYGPSKAANAGQMALLDVNWTAPPSAEELDRKVQDLQYEIYSQIARTAEEFSKRGDLYAGANIAGFLRVATAMLQQGSV